MGDRPEGSKPKRDSCSPGINLYIDHFAEQVAINKIVAVKNCAARNG